jgi:hypothetical protein
MPSLRSKLMTAAAIGAAAISGTAIPGCAGAGTCLRRG